MLNFELSKIGEHLGWAIKTVYKKLNRGILKLIYKVSGEFSSAVMQIIL